MNKIIIFVMGALVGAAAGVFGTLKYAENKYQKISNEEIRTIRKHFTVPKKVKTEEVPVSDEKVNNLYKAEQATKKPDITAYTSQLKGQGVPKVNSKDYVNYASYYKSETVAKHPIQPDSGPEEEEGTNERPYIVAPDEYGEKESYEGITLMYYSDDVLTDDNDVPVENAKEIVGNEYMHHFGEFEADCVYIRNDQLKCDYEILRDARTYTDVSGNTVHFRELKPHETEE